jgi:hypothetical protein
MHSPGNMSSKGMATTPTGFRLTIMCSKSALGGNGRGTGVFPATTFTGLLSLAGGVLFEFLQCLFPRSRAQLSLLHGDPGRGTASWSFSHASRSHSHGRPTCAQDPRRGGSGRGGTGGALRSASCSAAPPASDMPPRSTAGGAECQAPRQAL